MYRYAFRQQELGYGTAISVILLGIGAVLALVYVARSGPAEKTIDSGAAPESNHRRPGECEPLAHVRHPRVPRPDDVDVLGCVQPDGDDDVPMAEQRRLDNFRNLGSIKRPLINSMVLSLSSAIVTVVAACLCAYPLSRYRLRFGKVFLYVILLSSGCRSSR
jgi:ABC-type glycerol-3-phosphate transport system permease component